jgi:hypothetical protein
MANVQKQFEQFHDRVRTDFETNKQLREKRDILVAKIAKHLADNKLPGFTKLDQGSYAMGTGTLPTEGIDYDIDTSLRFHIRDDEYDAKVVRGWVLAAVKGHTDRIEDRSACVRVVYADGYHVDLVSYAWWGETEATKKYRLAHKTNGWRPADPPKLIKHVDDARARFKGTEDNATKTDQFRRCVRYLRRWDMVKVPSPSAVRPTGLAHVLYAANNLWPAHFFDGTPDDRAALEQLSSVAANAVGRLTAFKPTPEYEDVYLKLSDTEMDKLEARFEKLNEVLRKAKDEADPVKACKLLQGEFGPDFPVPVPEETAARTSKPAIITTSSSA